MEPTTGAINAESANAELAIGDAYRTVVAVRGSSLVVSTGRD